MGIGASFELCTKQLFIASNEKNIVYIWFVGVLIRRKKSDTNPLAQIFVPPILSAQSPTKFIIEVANSTYQKQSTDPLIACSNDKIISLFSFFFFNAFSLAGGTVRIYSENDQLEPIASVFDPIIVPVAYVSFCAFDNLALFYYDCSGQH